ncbi:hypothetical protein Avbf_12112 [Armadillidium vulgare]|nr:hypothetical protein Avbf_12112 [Armadillidium vulgare]
MKNVENILRESLIKLSKPLKSMQHKYVSRYSGTVKDVIEKFEEIRDAEEKDEYAVKYSFVLMTNLMNEKIEDFVSPSVSFIFPSVLINKILYKYSSNFFLVFDIFHKCHCHNIRMF